MRVFISGPMTGYAGFNRAVFDAAERTLKSQGHVVLNPAVLTDGLTQAQYMDICLAMVRCADALFMLQGWAGSAGARAERALAQKLGHRILYQAPPSENAGLKSDVPLGAIENGSAFADRLENYQFECEGGNLNMCSDWQEFRRCFEHLSEWVMHSQTEHPATDAFLAEVRAQGVEMFAECAYTLEHHDHAVAFAAELRKGGNQ